MKFRQINNIAGWCVAAIALTVYLLTLEPTVSFWDCGEFLSCAYKLEVGHSPGAPFFMLLQRMFGMLAGSKEHVALFINAESALASALTILFLFWTITHMARKLVAGKSDPDGKQTLLIIGSGLVGALAYTFSDTFWFSAVEAEVYATSSFFTALVFWAALKWEEQADEIHADRWLVLIAFLIGISVGVHLLNLLAIPAVAMIYYFRRYQTTTRGMITAFFTGIIILAFVQFGVIQYLPIFASRFDLLFVNSFGLPFNSGAIFFLLLLSGVLVWGIIHAKRKGKYVLHISLLSVSFIIIGFSSYLVPVIRSNADTPVDMTNPDNAMSLVAYVQRSQYLQQPLLTGPDFTSPITGVDKKGEIYGRTQKDGKDHYEHIDDQVSYRYEEGGKRFFPRIWDQDEGHAKFYRQYLQLDEGEEPTAGDNYSYFFNYQLGWMWWRYFMWNYSGRQNSYHGHGDAKHGNWITGIKAIDQMKVGDVDKMNSAYRNNMARNEYYMLPFILGLLGMVYQFNRNRKDAGVVAILFFFTGIAIAIYLNMTPLQPRERDYAFAGSTYAFAIWIGLGMLMVQQWMQRAVKGASGITIAIVLCLVAVPALMAKEGWDDHDRSQRMQARASAYNTLTGCAPNAILFCSADNDTYPLWYLQEVEGVRPDVRVIITELLGTDWYIDQLNYRINDAAPVPMAWTKNDHKGNNHNYIPVYPSTQLAQDQYYDLGELCQFINSTDPGNKLQNSGGNSTNYMPAANVSVSGLSKTELIKNGLAKDTSMIQNGMKFTIEKKHLYKNDLAILHIIAGIAKEGWKRPIYFNGSYPANSNTLGMGRYMHMEGINYRLLPFTYNGQPSSAGLDSGPVDADKSIDLVLHKYTWGGTERSDIHFDDKHQAMMISYRLLGSRLAGTLISQGRKQEAIQVLDKINGTFSETSYPYDMTAVYLAAAYYDAGAAAKAVALGQRIAKNAADDIAWVNTLSEEKQSAEAGEIQMDLSMLNQLANNAKNAGDHKHAAEWQGQLEALYSKMLPVLNSGK
jgi:hypothetical protein